MPYWYETGIFFEKVRLGKKKDEYTSKEFSARATENIVSLKCEYTVYITRTDLQNTTRKMEEQGSI